MIRVARKVLCLDWDKRSLRIVVARIGGGTMKLEDAHAHRFPANVDAADPKVVGGVIAQLLERHRIRLNRAIVDVPRDRAVINRLRVPPTPPEELAAAVRFQAMRELPFPLDEAQIDYVITERDADGRATEVLLAAVRSEVLEQLRETCLAAGLTPARIGLRPYANLLAVNRLPGMLERRTLFLDVGPSMTEIDVFVGPMLGFSRAANVSVPFVAGELVGDASRISSRGEIAGLELADEAETSAVEELLVEITRTLQAYRATEPNATIDQVVIAGGTGIEHALLHAVDERFGLPTTLFDPTVALGVDEAEAPKLRPFSAALGLAWGLSRESLLELDFLNPKKPQPPRASLRRRLQFAGIGVGALALIGISAAVADMLWVSRQLEALRAANSAKAGQAGELQKVLIRTLEVGDWESEALLAVWLDHLLTLTEKAVDPGKQMVVSDLSCDLGTAKITLKLAAAHWDVARDFVDRLNAVEQDGKRVYLAETGTWQEADTGDPKFKGRVDVTVTILALRDLQNGTKEREKERRKLERL